MPSLPVSPVGGPSRHPYLSRLSGCVGVEQVGEGAVLDPQLAVGVVELERVLEALQGARRLFDHRAFRLQLRLTTSDNNCITSRVDRKNMR